ncbi:MAG TPA: CinA family nicotinamide mononucleotide deamidase-related protein [Holophaga sp.]|mgnify:CR=1 FL=1|nr:CinA family nicotinamide mononucleotide deamidase-related protein [Holophaga sp.]
MRIECIAIGTELLTTTRVDTNSVWLAQRLADLGLAFHRKTAVGDHREDLRALFREALDRSDLIVCTGGLGPTFDDFTKEVLAEIVGAPMIENTEVMQDILDFHARIQRPMPETNRKQALVPVGAEALRNPVGTAPGIWWEDPLGHPGKRVALLPGVPREMKFLWEHEIEPRLRPLAGAPIHTLRMLVGSIGESALEMRTTPLREKHSSLDWTILASLGVVEFVARSADPAALEAARVDFEAELGADRISTGGATLEETLLSMLAARFETLAIAESMTGGLIASRLTAIPGASQSLMGASVVYSGQAKGLLADVPASVLEAHGTVSEATSRALAEGIRNKLDSTWGLGLTGNAGPTQDAQGQAPIGTCCLAIAGPKGTQSWALNFTGERTTIQTRSATRALDELRRTILANP